MFKPYKVVLLIIFFIIDAFCLNIIVKTRDRVSVKLVGNDQVNQTVGYEYNDGGFSISLNGKDIDINESIYEIINEVDTSILGEYVVTYNIKYKDKEYVLERKINVVDDEAPVITTSVEEVTLGYCNNELIDSLEYTANDNYDGDVTDRVKKEETDDKVILTVDDSNGNRATKELLKKTGDKPDNKVVLNGRSSISLELGTPYSEEGAYLTDGCGIRIGGDIETSGSVDINKEGKYTITYKSKDNEDIKTTRKITVYKETAQPATGKGIIYLTFDDGPGAYTQQILNTLDKHGIKATFFVTNQFPAYKYMIKEEFNRGHTVAVHSLTHNWNIYQSSASYWNDFNSMNDIIEQQTGTRTTILRFPGGTSNHMANKTSGKVGMSTLVNEVNAKGLHYFDWNVSVEDAGGCVKVADKVSCVVNNFKRYINPNRENIVLMHDIKKFTADGLESMITYAKNQGYTFKRINNDTAPVHFKPYQ